MIKYFDSHASDKKTSLKPLIKYGLSGRKCIMSVEHEDPFVKIAALIGGDEYLKVARSLLNTEDATDEEIASSTGLRINIVRKVLYDLFGKALIS